MAYANFKLPCRKISKYRNTKQKRKKRKKNHEKSEKEKQY